MGQRSRWKAATLSLGKWHARALHPLESHFGQDEVIPLGVEAAFAASFVERFGVGTEKAVKSLHGRNP